MASEIIMALTAVSQTIGIAKDLREMDKEVDRAEFKLKIADLATALADEDGALGEPRYCARPGKRNLSPEGHLQHSRRDHHER
jgi:hypothetical protein